MTACSLGTRDITNERTLSPLGGGRTEAAKPTERERLYRWTVDG